jgi:hypothetical protein
MQMQHCILLDEGRQLFASQIVVNYMILSLVHLELLQSTATHVRTEVIFSLVIVIFSFLGAI